MPKIRRRNDLKWNILYSFLSLLLYLLPILILHVCKNFQNLIKLEQHLCVCVCVCVWERERERETYLFKMYEAGSFKKWYVHNTTSQHLYELYAMGINCERKRWFVYFNYHCHSQLNSNSLKCPICNFEGWQRFENLFSLYGGKETYTYFHFLSSEILLPQPWSYLDICSDWHDHLIICCGVSILLKNYSWFYFQLERAILYCG
jgi:hypothetical protein